MIGLVTQTFVLGRYPIDDFGQSGTTTRLTSRDSFKIIPRYCLFGFNRRIVYLEYRHTMKLACSQCGGGVLHARAARVPARGRAGRRARRGRGAVAGGGAGRGRRRAARARAHLHQAAAEGAAGRHVLCR